MSQPGSALADRALEVAGIGGWELDVTSGQMDWTLLTFQLHEVDVNMQPSLEASLDFYPTEARPIIADAIHRAIETGSPWDLELPFMTATGRRRWVRVKGRAIRSGGCTIALTGSFEDITGRHDLTEGAERLSVVARQMTNAVIITNPAGLTEWVNDAFCRLTGFTLEEMRGRPPGSVLQGPSTDPSTVCHMRECLLRGEGFDVEIVNYTRQRQPYWMAVTCTPITADDGRITGFIAVESDISARRAAEDRVKSEAAERQRAEALLRDVLEALPSAVTAYDAEERLVLANRAYSEMFAIAAPFAIPGRPLEELESLAATAGQYADVGKTPQERDAWLSHLMAEHRATGASRTLWLPDGHFVLASERRSESGNLVCVRTDTTELHNAQEALRRQAERDSLTELANRAALLRALEAELALARAGTGRSGTMIIFDIDHFKQINDTLGHDVGDAVLVEVAARLRRRIRQTDIAARLGGDEFAVLLPELAEATAVADRALAIQSAMASPMEIGGRRMTVTISAGTTCYPADGVDAQRLLKNADLALYEAKRKGRARFCGFRPEMAEEMVQHAYIASALRKALAEGAVTIAFQPKRLVRGGHAGFEALARWHDGNQWVPPSEFIPVAEASGLITQLGTVVMEQAIARLRALRDRGFDPGRVAVNVTGPQLLQSGFLGEIRELLQRHGLEPADLELEVTETVLLGRSAEQVENTLREVRALGVALSLDDFGTGFASLAHLSRLPIDRIKIDRSFIAEIGLGGRGGVIARTVIHLARSLGLESVAEGVETEAQLAFLDAEGCDAVQGFLFSRPLLSLEEAGSYLASNRLADRQPLRKRQPSLAGQSLERRQDSSVA